MPRRPRQDDDDISLFPFLSIIASVIGVLTMMIASLTLAQTRTSDVAADLAKIEDFEKTEKETKQAEDRIEALRQKISVSKSTTLRLMEEKKELAMTVEELEKLLQELEEIENQLAEQKKIQIVIPKLDPSQRESANDMQTQLDAIKEEIAQLEKDLKERKEVPTEGNVTVLPQGSGLNFTPHFVECAKGAIVLHNMEMPRRVRQAEIVSDKDFLGLMSLVANGKDDSIVFLVRSDGLGTYRACTKLCNEKSIRNGKIPVVGHGRIDLSAFNRKRDR